jgi:hypothetical protein
MGDDHDFLITLGPKDWNRVDVRDRVIGRRLDWYTDLYSILTGFEGARVKITVERIEPPRPACTPA